MILTVSISLRFATLSTIILLTASDGRTAPASQRRKVVVVGAGISGASAARHLLDSPEAAQLDVMVLEARNRTGGRIFTDYAALPETVGAEVDLGAAWIHGYGRGNPLYDIVNENGIQVRHTEFDLTDMDVYYENGTRYSDRAVNRTSSQLEAAIGTIAHWESHWQMSSSDVAKISSLDDLLRGITPPRWMVDPLNQLLVSSYLEFEFAATLKTISAQLYDMAPQFAGGDWMIAKGYSQLVEAVLSGRNSENPITPRLNTEVTEIDYTDREQVRLKTRDAQTILADRVIVTLPLGVLKNGDVQFKPPLPDIKRTSISRVGNGVVNKLILQFDRVFWPDATLGFAVAPSALNASEAERRLYRVFVNAKLLVGVPTLVTFAFADQAERAETMTDDEVKEIARARLRVMFGARAVDEAKIVGMVRSRWRTDRFARGAYVFPKVGNTIGDFYNLAAPVSERLFFAGEYTYWLYHGTVHGSVLSGRRAAREAIASLNLSVVSPSDGGSGESGGTVTTVRNWLVLLGLVMVGANV